VGLREREHKRKKKKKKKKNFFSPAPAGVFPALPARTAAATHSFL
jgi:hypothetical protein